MEQLTKCHAFQVHVVVENLDVGWRVCEVVSVAALRVRLWVWSMGLAVSLCDPHTAHTLGRNSNVPRSPPLALHVRVRTLPPCTSDPSVSSFHAHTVPPYQAFRSCSSLRIISSNSESLPCFIRAPLFRFSLI
jgi:hypothetical protein